MEVGIGLPNAVAGAQGRELIEWSRRAEEAGFASLGTIDRLVYPSYEPLVSLAAAAAVTERIKLVTSILLAPIRTNTALLAKQAASVDHLSGGRLVLGLAVGMREDDFTASGAEFHRRGAYFDRQLEELRRIWGGEKLGHAGGVGPEPVRAEEGVQLWIGGAVRRSFERAAKYASGWIMSGGTPEQFAEQSAGVKRAWQEAGREGTPYLGALAYFALGPRAREHAERSVGHYYDYLGDVARQIVDSVATDEETVRQYIDAYAEVGCDELILFPASSDPGQVDLLAEAALAHVGSR